MSIIPILLPTKSPKTKTPNMIQNICAVIASLPSRVYVPHPATPIIVLFIAFVERGSVNFVQISRKRTLKILLERQPPWILVHRDDVCRMDVPIKHAHPHLGVVAMNTNAR